MACCPLPKNALTIILLEREEDSASVKYILIFGISEETFKTLLIYFSVVPDNDPIWNVTSSVEPLMCSMITINVLFPLISDSIELLFCNSNVVESPAALMS